MDYGEDEALHFGAAYYPERDDCQTEFHLICARQKSAENDRPVKKLLAEARFTAERIRQLLDEGYPVTDGDGTLRPCRPEDIVILMRSPRQPGPGVRRSPGGGGTSPVPFRRAATSSTPWRSPSWWPCWRWWTTPGRTCP